MKHQNLAKTRRSKSETQAANKNMVRVRRYSTSRWPLDTHSKIKGKTESYHRSSTKSCVAYTASYIGNHSDNSPLAGQQSVEEKLTKTTAASGSNESYIKCEWCGCSFKQISMTQHKKLYCPMLDQDTQIDPRTNRKFLRPPPPKAKVETTEGNNNAKTEMPKTPYVHHIVAKTCSGNRGFLHESLPRGIM